MSMTPAEFAAKWKANTTKETAGSKEQFIDLCRMLGYPTPTEADPTGDFYAFEKGLTKSHRADLRSRVEAERTVPARFAASRMA